MRFIPTPISGAYRVELHRNRDERGSFARTFCAREFLEHEIVFEPQQLNISSNPKAYTLRGMHYQDAPYAEAKLIQCVKGRIFDAAVDLRKTSPTFMQTAWLELDAGGDVLFYLPPGCAHGFLTLEADSDVLYYMGSAFVPGVGRGIRWDDPAIVSIPWPRQPECISERDAQYRDWLV